MTSGWRRRSHAIPQGILSYILLRLFGNRMRGNPTVGGGTIFLDLSSDFTCSGAANAKQQEKRGPVIGRLPATNAPAFTKR
jgi:hypothetical protein